MPIRDWNDRLEAIRRNCERLEDILKKSPCPSEGKVLQKFEIGPPATEKELAAAEKQIGFEFPESFRKVMLEFSASFCLEWFLPKNDISAFSAEYCSSRCGGCEWNLADIVAINCRRDYNEMAEICVEIAYETAPEYFRSFFEDRRICLEIINGDAVMMKIGHKIDEEISYFMHDGGPAIGFGTVLGRNFEDFIDRWMRLAFDGQDYWDWKPYIEKDGLNPDSEPGRHFQAWFFAE